MKVYVPEYFKNFRCIADKCPDTCCAGWEVNLDRESTEFYKTVSGNIGDKLRSRLAADDEGNPVFTLSENNRCPFLNGSNLCELYIRLGEKSLCRTCTIFPRFYDDFGLFREMGLGLGCPEAARIILNGKNSFELCEYGETQDTSDELDPEFLDFLLGLRERFFVILEDSELNLKEKITKILKLSEAAQKSIDGENIENPVKNSDFSECISLLSQMEYIDENRKNTLLSLNDEGFDKGVYEKYQSDFVKLMQYYIFRYMLESVYDYDLLTKIKYGAFACIVTGRLYVTDVDRIKAVYGYSKEVEYSDINMEILDKGLYESFSADSLIALL